MMKFSLLKSSFLIFVTETESAKVVIEPGLLVGLTVATVASVNSNNNKMVASSHSLEELGVTHPASASGDRGVPETNRTAQTALDKRSRLSNVINNLRKKVPEPQTTQQLKNDNDGRNSVERNLENIEKYVMTVLNGVIKDEEEKKEEDGKENDDIGASYPPKIEEQEWPSVEPPSATENANEALEGAKSIVEDPILLPDQEKEDPAKLMDVCRELVSDLLNNINQLMEERSSRDQENLEPRFSGSSPTSLHCSLPLDKVAPMLRSCGQENPSPQRSPSRPSPPTIRHLCLYCDRKFLSISLRQRHTERVHQVGGGSRRSERNSRRTVQSCQYCEDSIETTLEPLDALDTLFKHMVKTHPDRYYACVQCSMRYATRETLSNHSTEVHGSGMPETPKVLKEQIDDEIPKKEAPASPEFDSTFYSSVSCNIRENLLHHLDGKLQSPVTTLDAKPSQQNFYDTNSSQIQCPIDISLTAATPVYTNSKEYVNDAAGTGENSSEHAQRPGKTRIHPRRVSFEKYNFPRKYDGKEPWSCSITDLSKFDISTQLTLRKKQQLTNALNSTINRLSGDVTTPRQNGLTEIGQVENPVDGVGTASVPSEDSEPNSPRCSDLNATDTSGNTIFTSEFANFMKLKRWDEEVKDRNVQPDIVYAELTGEWSRPRIYVCGACEDRHVS